jgi:hypothetical protein
MDTGLENLKEENDFADVWMFSRDFSATFPVAFEFIFGNESPKNKVSSDSDWVSLA